MYGTRYPSNQKDMIPSSFMNKPVYWKGSLSDTNYIYSDSVTYDEETNKYTLVNGENRLWSSTYVDGANQYKYTCFSETEDSCEEVKYIVQSTSSTMTFYIPFSSGEMAEDGWNLEIVYGNDVTYDSDTGMYTLVTTTTTKLIDWKTEYQKIVGENGYHYTCFSESNTCSEVNYIFYHDSSIATGIYGSSFYVILNDGKKIDDVFIDSFKNTNDSLIKTVLDTWYENNIIDYSDMLEDTVWCNDRRIYNYVGWNKDLSGVGQHLYFTNWGRSSNLFQCSITDSFTVSDTVNGNGALKYPIGLLTSDEVTSAGASCYSPQEDYYLYTGSTYWTLTPHDFVRNAVQALFVVENGSLNQYNNVSSSFGVRPSISLKEGVVYVEGDGTISNPYIIERY